MSVSNEVPCIRVQAHRVAIDSTFWTTLHRVYLVEWKTAEALHVISGTLSSSTGNVVVVDHNSFSHPSPPDTNKVVSTESGKQNPKKFHSISVHVFIRNFKTFQRFQNENNQHDEYSVQNDLYSLLLEKWLLPLLEIDAEKKGKEEKEKEEEEAKIWGSISFFLTLLHTFVDSKNNKVYYRTIIPSLTWSYPTDTKTPPCLVEVLASSRGEAMHRQNPQRGEACTCTVSLTVAEAIRKAVRERAFINGIGAPLLAVTEGENLLTVEGFASTRFWRYCREKKESDKILFCFPLLGSDEGKEKEEEAAVVVDDGLYNFLHLFALTQPNPLPPFYLYGVGSGPNTTAKDVLSLCQLRRSLSSLDECWREWRSAVRSAVEALQQHKEEVQRKGPRQTASSVDLHPYLGAHLPFTFPRSPIQEIPLLVEADEKMKQNLLLLKWQRPQLKLTQLSQCRALLLGAGTLGGQVGSHLLSWGVRRITFVDCGQVGYNNMGRQILFTAEDAKERRLKALAAADALRQRFPSAVISGEVFRIPTPGNRVESEAELAADVKHMSALIQSHDVVFSLLDSYAARWLPAVLTQIHQKPHINIAIGFDEFLVMRYPLDSEDHASDLSCYFCNKTVALDGSGVAATLDQQCSVTRPGVATMAASLGVELLAVLYQHPQHFHAPTDAETCLGKCFALRRGTVHFGGKEFMTHSESRNPFCTACSPAVAVGYHTDGVPFLVDCIASPARLREYLAEVEKHVKAEVDEDTDRQQEEPKILSFSTSSDDK